MKFLDDYIAYLNDNPEGYWFKRKLYGFGWTPATKEGWLTVLGYLVFVIVLVLKMPLDADEPEVVKRIILPVALATLLLIIISWRTGEPLKWQWGQKHEKEKQ